MGKIHKLMVLAKEYGPITALKMAKAKLSSGPKAMAKEAADNIRKTTAPECLASQKEQKFIYEPTISILVPLYNTEAGMLKCVIESMLNQTYSKWELCLADGSDEEHKYVSDICEEYSKDESRIKYHKLDDNKGISANTNACAKLAEGEYMGLLDHDDVLHPSALFEVVKSLNEERADYIYTDEITFSGEILNILSTNYKPDYAKDTLRCNNYIGHFVVFTRELFNQVGGFRSEYDGSQDHDLALRMTEVAGVVKHIPKILYFWRAHKGSVVEDVYAKEYAINAGINAVNHHIKTLGLDAVVESSDIYPTIYRIKYAIKSQSKITIIIPNKNSMPVLMRCLDSIFKSTYDNYEIIIVENNSTDQEIFDCYKELEANSRIRIITREGEFNYSALNNLAVKYAKGEYLVFLNNDTEVINPNWLTELLMYAQREDVGAVGARLFYPNDTIQHCYLKTGAGEHQVAIHMGLGLPKNDYGYLDRIGFVQNVNALTGACLMIARDKFEAVGGFDEKLPVAYNDVDICLALRAKGFLNVYTPYATLYHYESLSRGRDNGERLNRDADYMHSKWSDMLSDPYIRW